MKLARIAITVLMAFGFFSKLFGASTSQPRAKSSEARTVPAGSSPASANSTTSAEEAEATKRELILCIPGPWVDRASFIRAVITANPPGKFVFAGGILADVATKDHVLLEFCEKDSRLAASFKIAGQGKISESCLDEIDQHAAVLYLRFPLDIVGERERLLKFTRFLRGLGGTAVKIESSGIAHTWEAWEKQLTGSLFDLYCASIVLVGDKDVFYSCGMHHFGLPECAVPREVGDGAAELINRFNFWRINERPKLAPGETFGLSADQPSFRLTLESDVRHGNDDLFHNPHGVWRLVGSSATIQNKWKKPEGEPLFVATPQDDRDMAAAYATAKATFPQFLKAIKSERFASATNSVKLKIRDDEYSAELGEDRFTYLWVWDVREDHDGFRARVIELPKAGINQLVEGEDVRFVSDAVHDWMLRLGPQAWGAFTMRVVRDRMDPQERLQFDEYTGILSYNENLF